MHLGPELREMKLRWEERAMEGFLYMLSISPECGNDAEVVCGGESWCWYVE
jgi:hypothetical protein